MARGRDEDEEELDEAVVHADIPNTFRELRACMTCSLVKTFTQFYDTGCENCAFLQMADNRQRVAECTSAYFEGMIAMMHPKESWVAKWQRIGGSLLLLLVTLPMKANAVWSMSSAPDPWYLRSDGLGRTARVHQAVPGRPQHPVPRAELSSQRIH